ncbi:hypothetical protein [Aquamicrobium ahrensii]|uniref:Uncharacterized protein n=1 Tax=Aquamicrobium ahrensii TaxID=469551 RepID=A0ABV2KP35_9HYPH
MEASAQSSSMKTSFHFREIEEGGNQREKNDRDHQEFDLTATRLVTEGLHEPLDAAERRSFPGASHMRWNAVGSPVATPEWLT